MSVAAHPVGGRDRSETARWAASLLVVLALHGALVLLVMRQRVGIEPIGTPPVAVLIDLPPAPPAAPEPAPAAEPVASEPLPAEPEPPPLPEPEPLLPKVEPSPTAHPPVALPMSPPKPRRQTKPVERPPLPRPPRPAPVPAMPTPAIPAPPAAIETPPGPASSVASTRTTWQAQLLAWLERHKHYPRVAQEQHQQGVAVLRFTLDRQGRILSYTLDRSSGFSLLDQEVLELIQRAQPVPPPPPDVAGERIEVLVPVSFSLHRGGR